MATSAMAAPAVATEALCDIATRCVPTTCRTELRSRGLCVISDLQISQEQMHSIASLCQQSVTASTTGGENAGDIWPNIQFWQGCISPRSPRIALSDTANIPREVIDVINDLVTRIWSWVQLSSNEGATSSRLRLDMQLRSGTKHVSILTENGGWHVDYIRKHHLLSVPHVRLICTLYGQTTKFLPSSKREKQLKAAWAIYRDQCKDRNSETCLPLPLAEEFFHAQRSVFSSFMARVFSNAQSPIFSPKPGEVVAFIAGSPNGTIHSSPMELDPRRIIVIFDVYDLDGLATLSTP